MLYDCIHFIFLILECVEVVKNMGLVRHGNKMEYFTVIDAYCMYGYVRVNKKHL